ncbi:goLoco motif domain-containing protein [Ditylenchus destructor]|nr:goLoco motif domain-containing protein [Ditylenchus destructor]
MPALLQLNESIFLRIKSQAVIKKKEWGEPIPQLLGAGRNSTNCDLYSVDASLALGNGDDPKCATNRHSSNSSLFTLNSPVMPLVQRNGTVDQKANDFLTLLERMQSQRLDDQRCEMPELVGNFFISLSFQLGTWLEFHTITEL